MKKQLFPIFPFLHSYLESQGDPPALCNFEMRHEEVKYAPHTAVQLKDAIVFDGIGNVFRNYDVILENGRISYVGPSKIIPNALIIDVKGNIVTPGLIDMHT